jgi:C4-dicarboxylate-specific signal transduction histidine kinase
LAAIVNNAEVARRLVERARTPGAAWDPLLDEVLQDVSSQGRRASEVVREFRRFLRREAGARERLVVRELLASTIELLRREYADAAVRLTWQVAPGTPPVQAERVLLQQVCVNLLQNALEAVRGRPGAEVLLRAREVGAGVRLTVADNGPGFAPAIRSTAFEPFVTARASGMGMGLAIARRIVEAHGGHVAIGRVPGAGAAVSVWLPSATSSGRLDTVATVPAAVAPEAASI